MRLWAQVRRRASPSPGFLVSKRSCRSPTFPPLFALVPLDVRRHTPRGATRVRRGPRGFTLEASTRPSAALDWGTPRWAEVRCPRVAPVVLPLRRPPQPVEWQRSERSSQSARCRRRGAGPPHRQDRRRRRPWVARAAESGAQAVGLSGRRRAEPEGRGGPQAWGVEAREDARLSATSAEISAPPVAAA